MVNKVRNIKRRVAAAFDGSWSREDVELPSSVVVIDLALERGLWDEVGFPRP